MAGNKRGNRMILTCLSLVTGRKSSCCDNISCLRYTRPTARSSFSSLLPANCFSSLSPGHFAGDILQFVKSTCFSLTSPYSIIRIFFSPLAFYSVLPKSSCGRFPKISGIGFSSHQAGTNGRKRKWVSPVLRMEYDTIQGL